MAGNAVASAMPKTSRVRSPVKPPANGQGVGFVPTPSPLSEWSETFLLRFPTHRVARMRQVDFSFFAVHNTLSNELLEEVAKQFELITKAMTGVMTAEDANNMVMDSIKEDFNTPVILTNLRNNRKFLEDYAVLAFVEPQVVYEVVDPQTQIEVSRLSIEELQFAWEYMWRPVTYLRLFCAQQAQSLEFVERGKNTR